MLCLQRHTKISVFVLFYIYCSHYKRCFSLCTKTHSTPQAQIGVGRTDSHATIPLQIHIGASVPQSAQGGGRSGGTARGGVRVPAAADHRGSDASVQDIARGTQGECVGLPKNKLNL